MQDVRQAIRDVFPQWLALCAIAVIWGITMQVLPGMEGQAYYPTQWAANLAHADPHSYLLVAEQGYGPYGRDLQSSVRFPLFPFFTRVVTQVTDWDSNVTMFVISKAALLAGLVGLWLLVAHLHGRDQAERAIPYMLFPLLGSGYTWMMSYPEALHLALWAFGFLLLYKRQYLACGLLTVLNVWTRPQGVLILPAFAFILVAESWRESGVRGLLDRKLWLRGLLTCGLPLLAFSAWIVQISAITQIPLSPMTAQTNYGRISIVPPWVPFITVFSRPFRQPSLPYSWEMLYQLYQYILILVAFITLCVLALRRKLPWALVLFTFLPLVLGLSTGDFAVGRFALLTWIPLAPLYVVPRRFDKAVMPIGIALSFLSLIVLGLIGGFTP